MKVSLIYINISLILVLLFFCYYLNISFPFYYLWDMDHTVTIDIISIFSNCIPTHINHPGVGTYIILSWLDLILYKLSFLSGLSITDISEAISPIFIIYEITNINKFFHIILIPIITFLLTTAISNFSKNKLNNLSYILIFTSIGSGYGLLYHSITIRSEIYSILFFSISFLLISNHQKIVNFYFIKGNLVLIGIFSGLVIFSKLQGIFYFFYLVVFALYYSNSLYKGNINKKSLVKHSIYNLSLFLIICYFSYKLPIQGGYAVFAEERDFKLNTFFYIFFFVYIFPFFGVTASNYLNIKYLNNLNYIIYNLNYILTGFLLSIFSPFIIPFDNSKSMTYSLWNFKILFIRKTYNELNIISSFKSFFLLKSPFYEEYKTYFIILVLITLLSIILNRFNLKKLNFLITIILLIIINTSIAGRYIYRDFIWIEILYIINICILINHINVSHINILRIIILFLIIISNLYKDINLKSSLQSQVILYGYNKKKHLETVYGDVIEFNHLINLKYPNNDSIKNIIKEYARIPEHINNAYSVIKIRPISSKMISILNKNLLINNYGYSIYNFPNFLEGFTVVEIPKNIEESVRFNPELVRNNIDVAGKLFNDNSGVLPILHRWDIDIYLLTLDLLKDININGKIDILTDKVQLKNKNNKIITYNLYKVNNYTEISKEEIINNDIYILIKDNTFLGRDDFF